MSYNRDTWKVLQQMGLDPNKHLPKYEVAPMTVDHHTLGRIWVSLMDAGMAKELGITQRLRGNCPHCDKQFALGNLRQHAIGYRRAGRKTLACWEQPNAA